MVPKATVTSKGQVMLPLAIRKALGLDAGTQLSFELCEGGFRVTTIRRKAWEDLWRIAKSSPRPPRPVDVDAAILAAVLERSRR